MSLLGGLTLGGAFPSVFGASDAEAKKNARASKKKKKTTPGPQGPPGADGVPGPAGPAGSFTCPSGTLLHEGVCIETAKRAGTPNFATAQSTCLAAEQRLPTIAELQTFRLRGGQDMNNTPEHTGHIWIDGATLAEMVVSNTGIPFAQQQASQAPFRCVAAPT